VAYCTWAAAAAVGVVEVGVAAAVHIEDGGVGAAFQVERHPAHAAALESDHAAPASYRAFRHVLMQPPAPQPRPPCVLPAMPVVTFYQLTCGTLSYIFAIRAEHILRTTRRS